MREGVNVEKTGPDLPPIAAHRIIVPIYVPREDGYFRDARDVLRLSLESLRQTAAGKARITLVSNGSTAAVNDELRDRYEEGWIDQLLINQRNWGKIDAAVSALRGTFEPLITISDGDVLFRAGWLEAVEELFSRFPECGAASPVPMPFALWYNTSATLLGALARGELTFDKVVPDRDLDRFAASVGRADLFPPDTRAAQLVVNRGGAVACVGCGHFIYTIRREVVAAMPRRPALRPLGGRGSAHWLDIPPDRAGFWRLSTTRAYAWHIGNRIESWMSDEVTSAPAVSEVVSIERAIAPPRRRWTSSIPWRVRRLLTQGIKKTALRLLFLRTLGHPHHSARTARHTA